ncbi:MAG TPA: chromate transporter [Clostridiales bacterium UBA8960]|jgi:chromate transporter|nr:chromate transporter [Clostridiales bacterium UBA8960]
MIELLFEFLKIGSFTYGGGLAMIPLLREISVRNAWLSDGQFADLIAISQSTPGPLAINMATYIGYKEAGIAGALLASVVLILPAFIMALAFSKVLAKHRKHPYVLAAFVGLKAAVIGLLATSIVQVAKVSIFNTLIDLKALLFLMIAYVVIQKTQKHPLYYILGFGIVSIFVW